MREVCQRARDKGILAVPSVYAKMPERRRDPNHHHSPPTLRIVVRASHEDAELKHAVAILDKIAGSIIGSEEAAPAAQNLVAEGTA